MKCLIESIFLLKIYLFLRFVPPSAASLAHATEPRCSRGEDKAGLLETLNYDQGCEGWSTILRLGSWLTLVLALHAEVRLGHVHFTCQDTVVVVGYGRSSHRTVVAEVQDAVEVLTLATLKDELDGPAHDNCTSEVALLVRMDPRHECLNSVLHALSLGLGRKRLSIDLEWSGRLCVKFVEQQIDLGIASLISLVKGCFEASDKAEALIPAQLSHLVSEDARKIIRRSILFNSYRLEDELLCELDDVLDKPAFCWEGLDL